jgi:hypothetical protein
MPQDQGSSDFSSNLQLERPAVRRSDTLRPGGLRSGAPASATAATTTTAPVKKTGTAEHTRPGVVTLIAMYEFWRACFLGGVYAMSVMYPRAHPQSQTFQTIFYVLSNGSLHVSPLTLVTTGYALAESITLWMLVNWGRRVLIATSGWAVIRLVQFLAVFSAYAATLPGGSAEIEFVRESTYMLTAVNLLLGLYLAFAPGVAEAFGQQK